MVDLSKFASEMYKPADDLAALAKEAEQRSAKRDEQSKFGDLRTIKFPKGKTEFILCPPYSDKGHIIYSTWTHWRLGDGGKGKAFCPRHTHPDKDWGCPVCWTIDILLKNGVDQDKLSGYNSPGATESAYSQILLLESDGMDLDDMEYLPHVVRFSPSVKDKVIGLYARYREKLFNPNAAIVLEMTVGEKRGKNGKTFPSYDLTTLPEQCAMASDEQTMANILKEMYHLEELGFYTGEWTEYDYRLAASHANHMLDEMGFKTVDSWNGALDDDWELDMAEVKEKELPVIPKELIGTGLKKAEKRKGGGGRPKNRRPSRGGNDDKEDD